MARPTLDFWFEFASTYSYLAAVRIETLAADRGIELRWRPFLLGPIFAREGWSTSPFNIYPLKGAYMWRDMERQSERLGLPLTHPTPFPQNSLAATRIAHHLRDSEWIGSFVRAVYLSEFGDGRDISDLDLLAAILVDIGAPAKEVVAAIQTAEVKEGLRAAVSEAEALGIFGAPSFVTADRELFWGNDRLEQAMDWAAKLQA